jgi:hypothetical protein
MNLSQIIKQVNRDVDDSFNSADITEWLNRCLDDLTPYVKKQARTAYTIDSSNQYALPSDYFDLVELVLTTSDSNGNTNVSPLRSLQVRDYDSKGYKVWGESFSLQKGPTDGLMDLFYYRKLTRLVNGADVPEIDEPFHDLLILYGIAQSQFMDEEPQREADAFTRYTARKQEYIAYRNNQDFEVYTINEVV